MANSSALDFTYKVLPSNATFPAVGGTVNAFASASSGAEGNAATTLPYVVPGSTTFFNARCARLACMRRLPNCLLAAAVPGAVPIRMRQRTHVACS